MDRQGLSKVMMSAPAPLLHVAEPAFDDVAIAVIGAVERGRAAAACPSPFAVSLLVGGLGNDGDDPPLA